MVIEAIVVAVIVYAALMALYGWYMRRDRIAAEKQAISDRDKEQ